VKPRSSRACALLRRLSLSATVCLASGCSVLIEDIGQTLEASDSDLEQLVHYRDVLELFGPPHQLAVGSQGMVFLYEEIDVNEKQLGISLSGKRVTLFKAVMARSIAERRLALALFDKSGALQAMQYEQRDDAAASGAALQFVFAVAGVVDDDDLSLPPATHEWGFGLLAADLAVALNRRQSLRYGDNGVEQKATPLAIGQHALEQGTQ